MPREKPLQIGTILQGARQYRVKRLVGGGGMAWVYQVEKLTGDDQPSLWALKELRPQTQDPDTQAHARALFNQEAAILSQLSHPNLPKVDDFFEDGDRAYLVMEFVWGESLEKRMEKARSPLLERQVLEWAVQICDVLDYLHSRDPKIIFRDLKPSNVMVSNQDVVKLIDFGIARTYKEDKLQDTIALGSENYAAPEQWGDAQTDPRSDIYGLGATMYHLLANMPPSPAFLPSEPQRVDKINSALSPDTVAIVTKAMARDREQRYQSAAEMKHALLQCVPSYVSPVERRPAKEPPAKHSFVDETVVQPHCPDPSPRPQDAARTEIRRPAAAVQQVSRPAVVQRRVRKVKVCPRCQHHNELASRFCVRCGYAFQGLRSAVLRVVEPVRAAWEMPVHKSPLLLGRALPEEGYHPDFDMSFYDPVGYVSRRHAQIAKARNGYFIADLGSSNGTYVNDQLLPPSKYRLLRNGDRIAIGEVVIQFLLR